MLNFFFLFCLILNFFHLYAKDRAEDLGDVILLESQERGVPFYNTRITSLNVQADFNQHIRAVIIATLNDQLVDRFGDTPEYQRISEVILDSYIEIQNIGGKPVALILGKQASSYGSEQSHFLNYLFQDEFERTSHSQRVLGLSVELNEKILGTIIETSFYRPYENFGGELGLPGTSLSIKKEVIENLVIKYSSMINFDLQTPETKNSVELVWTSDKFETWGNIQKFNSVYVGGTSISGVSYQVGVDFKLNDKMNVVFQVSAIDKYMVKFDAGIEYEIKSGYLYLFPSYSLESRSGEDEGSLRLLFRVKY